jgi:hypothetical protein
MRYLSGVRPLTPLTPLGATLLGAALLAACAGNGA